MKMKLLAVLCVATTWVVANAALNQYGDGPSTIQLTSQYRTKKAVGNLGPDPDNNGLAGTYFSVQLCEEEKGIENIAVTVVIPGNAAFKNNTWAGQHGLIDMQIATSPTFANSTMITSNYLPNPKKYPYSPLNRVVFRYGDQSITERMFYIRIKSYRVTTRALLEVAYEDSSCQLTAYTPDPVNRGWNTWDQTMPKPAPLVQYAATKDPTLSVSGDSFVYFHVKFCGTMQNDQTMTATVIGLPRTDGDNTPTQAAFNLLLCNPTTMVPYDEICINPGPPSVIKWDMSAAPVVSVQAQVDSSSIFNIADFILGVQGQGGYRGECNGGPCRYDEGVNMFALAVQIS